MGCWISEPRSVALEIQIVSNVRLPRSASIRMKTTDDARPAQLEFMPPEAKVRHSTVPSRCPVRAQHGSNPNFKNLCRNRPCEPKCCRRPYLVGILEPSRRLRTQADSTGFFLHGNPPL